MSIKVFLSTSVTKNNSAGKWLLLPARQERLGTILQKLNCGIEPPDFFVTDEKAEITYMRGTINSYLKAVRLNNLARDLHALSEHEENIFYALMECEYLPDISIAERILKQLCKWELLYGIDTDAALDKFFVEHHNQAVKDSDYTNLGIDIRSQHKCIFTSLGCLIQNSQ